MQPSLDPVQFSALLGLAAVRALAAALFFALQLGPALKVYSAGPLVEAEVEVEVVVEVAVEAVVEVVEVVEVVVEVAVEVVVEVA